MNYIIYLLVNTCNSNTYIGITNNKERRIRQHNGELVGGAKYTCAKKGDGQWLFYGWIMGNNIILEKNRSLSLEKKIKIKSKKVKIPKNLEISSVSTPLLKRLIAINFILEQNPDLIFIKP